MLRECQCRGLRGSGRARLGSQHALRMRPDRIIPGEVRGEEWHLLSLAVTLNRTYGSGVRDQTIFGGGGVGSHRGACFVANDQKCLILLCQIT